MRLDNNNNNKRTYNSCPHEHNPYLCNNVVMFSLSFPFLQLIYIYIDSIPLFPKQLYTKYRIEYITNLS